MIASVGVPGGIALGAQRVFINASVNLSPETLSNTARHIFLVISGIQFDRPPEAHYEIYFNKPPSIQPDLRSIYFVGNLTFFVTRNTSYSQRFDISNLFRVQLEVGLAGVDVARITLVLQGVPDAPGAAVTVAEGSNARISGAVVTDVLPSAPP